MVWKSFALTEHISCRTVLKDAAVYLWCLRRGGDVWRFTFSAVAGSRLEGYRNVFGSNLTVCLKALGYSAQRAPLLVPRVAGLVRSRAIPYPCTSASSKQVALCQPLLGAKCQKLSPTLT